MNSLNIISSRVSPTSSPGPSRTNSLGSLGLAVASPRADDGTGEGPVGSRSGNDHAVPQHGLGGSAIDDNESDSDEKTSMGADEAAHEESPLLGGSKSSNERSLWWHRMPRTIATAVIGSLRWLFSTLASPGAYLIACLCDDDGSFAPFGQVRRLFRVYNGRVHKISADFETSTAEKDAGKLAASDSRYGGLAVPAHLSSGTSSAVTSESESDSPAARTRGARNRSPKSAEEIAPARRSIRIKLHNDEALRERKHKRAKSSSSKAADGGSADIANQLKSPTSPVGALTKYPKTPAPPRPLVPRRQPSYLNIEPADRKHQKTLILDLDETLIHSMSKGGRMGGTGHMVEVRLNATYTTHGGQTSVGPQHPILYYVNKRPFCDDFLKRVCKWYNLVIFTASVPEYADPVIDWLEQDRKFFSGRYYRQHCTFRQGAFIKDLASVEADLSRVMILDNSPLSYMFHQDNAIPIQGWINDPTDRELVNLVPLLEGLQYVSDVRALLALRGGEDGQHMA